jgi:hypothetical protein
MWFWMRIFWTVAFLGFAIWYGVNLDLALLVLSIILTVLLALVGVEMANNPPTTAKHKRIYRSVFITIGFFLIVVTYGQGVRNGNEQQRLRTDASDRQGELEGRLNQMQGKLNNIENFVSHPPRTFSPADVNAAVRAMVGQQQPVQVLPSYGNLPARCNALADAVIGRAQWRIQQRPDRQADLDSYKRWFEMNDGFYFRADLYEPIKEMQTELLGAHFDDAQLDELMKEGEMYYNLRQMNVNEAIKNPEAYHLPIEKIMEIGQRLKTVCPK